MGCHASLNDSLLFYLLQIFFRLSQNFSFNNIIIIISFTMIGYQTKQLNAKTTKNIDSKHTYFN